MEGITPVADDVLKTISEHLCAENRDLGRKLGLAEGVIQKIITDNRDDSQEQNYQLLLRWKQGNGINANYKVLAKALCDVKRTDLAHKMMTDFSLVGSRQAMEEMIKCCSRGELSSSTVSSYRSSLTSYMTYCKQNKCVPIPALPETILSYIEQLAEKNIKPSSILSYLTIIRLIHCGRGCEFPCDHHSIREAMTEGAKKENVHQGTYLKSTLDKSTKTGTSLEGVLTVETSSSDCNKNERFKDQPANDGDSSSDSECDDSLSFEGQEKSEANKTSYNQTPGSSKNLFKGKRKLDFAEGSQCCNTDKATTRQNSRHLKPRKGLSFLNGPHRKRQSKTSYNQTPGSSKNLFKGKGKLDVEGSQCCNTDKATARQNSRHLKPRKGLSSLNGPHRKRQSFKDQPANDGDSSSDSEFDDSMSFEGQEKSEANDLRESCSELSSTDDEDDHELGKKNRSPTMGFINFSKKTKKMRITKRSIETEEEEITEHVLIPL